MRTKACRYGIVHTYAHIIRYTCIYILYIYMYGLLQTIDWFMANDFMQLLFPWYMNGREVLATRQQDTYQWATSNTRLGTREEKYNAAESTLGDKAVNPCMQWLLILISCGMIVHADFNIGVSIMFGFRAVWRSVGEDMSTHLPKTKTYSALPFWTFTVFVFLSSSYVHVDT